MKFLALEYQRDSDVGGRRIKKMPRFDCREAGRVTGFRQPVKGQVTFSENEFAQSGGATGLGWRLWFLDKRFRAGARWLFYSTMTEKAVELREEQVVWTTRPLAFERPMRKP